MLTSIFSFLQTVLAFVVALSFLVVIHEYAHYRMAVACGVKVLRFSLGFGKPLLSWRRGTDQTEYVLAPIPLGGYVRMLDEREAPVRPDELHRAFNRQRARSKALIIAAGPCANLLLAIFLFAIVSYMGIKDYKPIFSAPSSNSIMSLAGFQDGDEVLDITDSKGATKAIQSRRDFVIALNVAALANEDLTVRVKRLNGSINNISLPLSQVGSKNVTPDFLKEIGFPYIWASPEPYIEDVLPKGAAARSHLQRGDIVREIDGKTIANSSELLKAIKFSVQHKEQQWLVERNGGIVSVEITPDVVEQDGILIGQVGAIIGRLETLTVHYGLWDGLVYGVKQVGFFCGFTLELIGKMIIGQASVKNLSGPVAVADIAGSAAKSGFIDYIQILAIISVSLGLLNLLPLPVLDGGQLVYVLIETIKGSPLSERVLGLFQTLGVFFLILVMLIATFNDILRIGFH